jgi:hypothetical protein
MHNLVVYYQLVSDTGNASGTTAYIIISNRILYIFSRIAFLSIVHATQALLKILQMVPHSLVFR